MISRSGPAAAGSRNDQPGVAELLARAARDDRGQFAKRGSKDLFGRLEKRHAERSPGQELVDETGTPILYAAGRNFAGRACARIMFPDLRWLRFPVRAAKGAHAIMTAVDQAGNKVARYRILDKGLDPGRKTSFGLSHSTEIIVHPGRELTDDLALALAISAGWLGSYFHTPAEDDLGTAGQRRLSTTGYSPQRATRKMWTAASGAVNAQPWEPR